MLRITNKHNNKSVSVRVNDRGPFVAARIIDLSRAAAQQIDMISTGTAPVIVESISAAALPAGKAPQKPVLVPVATQMRPPQAADLPVQPAGGGTNAAGTPATESQVLVPIQSWGQTTQVSQSPAQTSQSVPVSSSPDLSAYAGNSGGKYRIQVGAYKQPGNATAAFDKLKAAGLSPAYEKYGELYRVVLSGIRPEDIKTVTEKISSAGFREPIIRVEE
jgi:rare lipoprotein A